MRLPLFLLIQVVVVVYGYKPDPRTKAMQNPNLFEGDMLINRAEIMSRNVIVGDNFRWPDAKVPYEIHSSLDNITDVIMKAIKDYHKHTCVQWVPRNGEEDFVRMYRGDGCYSDVGRLGGENQLSLGEGCNYVGTAVHEMGHAIGLYHEQSRSDRDDYLEIFLENVDPDSQFNFDKLDADKNLLLADFDHQSVMIYGHDAFSKNGKDTMRAKNGETLTNPYSKRGMSKTDAQIINKMYNC